MVKDQNEAVIWSRIHHLRQTTPMGRARLRALKRTGLIGVAYVLVGVAVWGVLAIYGPVIAAEGGYQWKKLALEKRQEKWWEAIVPNFSFELLPAVIGSEWGIVIPKIFLQEKVVANVDPTNRESYLPALRMGIAHAAGTELPGGGGLGYYFAHSSGMNVLSPQKEAAFYLLGKLDVGDEVQVYNYGKKYGYKVKETRIVEAGDLTFLEEWKVGEKIVLQTCWPIGTSAKRLLVMAERV